MTLPAAPIPIQPAPILHFSAASVRAAIEADRERVTNTAPPDHSQRVENKIQKDLIPFERDAFGAGGSVAYVLNPDPVLRYLTVKGCEAEWRDMEKADATVSGEVMKRKRRLLAAGTELIAAGEKPSQKTLFEAGKRALKSINNWNASLSLILDARFWGWRPMQVQWSEPQTFQGRRMQFPVRLLDHKPEEFAFTRDRELIHLDGWGRERKLTTPADRLMWLTPSAGSTSNPYGVALYRQGVWLTYYIRQRFLEYLTAGTQRSTGIIKVVEKSLTQGESMLGGAATRAKKTVEIVQEMREVMSVLSDEGFLVQRDGYVIEFLDQVTSATDSWLKSIEYFDKLLRILINSGTLTSDIGSVGSRAATSEHSDEADNNAVADAKEVLEPCINDSLLAKFFSYNFGEVDPDDVPKLRSKLATKTSLDNAEKMFNMGAVLDAKRLAQDAGVPLAEGSEDQKLEKQAAPMNTQGALPFGEPDPKKKQPARKERDAKA